MKWRLLGGAVALAALAWSGWWFIGAAGHDAALRGWLTERRAEGWQAEIADLTTRGFPNRFDTRVTGLALADPEVGWAWQAPFLDLMQLSYQPNAAVLAFAPEQTLAVPGARAVLRAETLRASVRFTPGTSLALARLSLEGAGLALEGADWRAAAAAVAAHLRAAEPGATPGHGYDLHLSADDVALPEALRGRLDPAGALPALAQTLKLDARVALDRPLDRFAVEAAPPGIEGLSLTVLEAAWGPLALRVQGRLRADAEGLAEGELTVRAENWREMLAVAVEAGALDADLARVIGQGLGLLAALGGDGSRIAAPLVFADGSARLGPIPLGRAPRLTRR